MPVLVEICVDGLENALAAAAAGADRIELCADLPRDGTTPGPGVIEVACGDLAVPVHVLVRPRPGDFAYTPAEWRAMVLDIRAAARAGAAGVAVGALTRDGRIDAIQTRRLVETARPMSVTFHRAFDQVPDPYEALEQLAELGVDRVLTSGRPGKARDHVDVLGELARRGAGRVIVLAAGGVTAEDIPVLAAAGIVEVHAGSAAVGGDGRVQPGLVRALRAAARRV